MFVRSFLDVPESEWLASNALAFAVRTRETTRGHTVIVTRRVVPTWFDATQEEKVAIVELIDVVKEKLQRMYEPDGFNVGFDTGAPAGQTVMRLHVHVIPRRLWDMGVPRGVRDILIAKYPPVRTLATGGERDPFLRHIAPLFETSTTVDIIAAFVQVSGLDSLRPYLDDSLARGAHVRLLTGDYLHITQAAALQQLLDWMASETVRDELLESDDRDPTPHARRGRLEVRVLEVESLPPRSRAFHPKSWRFAGPGGNVLFVGSSNISRSALETGIEWNLRIDEDRDAKAVHEAYLEFDRLWKDARAIDAAFVEEYAARARAYATLPIGEDTDEELPAPPDPHEIQAAALAALRRTREEGRRRGLVVLATGLGKTWLSAFDVAAFEDELRRRPRVLFLAHRAEILRQASRTFRILLRTRHARTRVAWFAESAASLDGDTWSLAWAGSFRTLTEGAHRRRCRDSPRSAMLSTCGCSTWRSFASSLPAADLSERRPRVRSAARKTRSQSAMNKGDGRRPPGPPRAEGDGSTALWSPRATTTTKSIAPRKCRRAGAKSSP